MGETEVFWKGLLLAGLIALFMWIVGAAILVVVGAV